ncbi:MAG TPA: flavodoxin-dependent (E)-4-hydroxy-3-methylbut-2-enyl-diphosphate synthase [Actinomycetota bacterium]|nr:flavodoxin-dependent (E)-4-hydroxy-3-methylbut-2-enyl-diphosphate synthase [Actinomycetota bacterium]
MIERRKTKQITVGSVAVGGDAPISVQSMCTTKTADHNATLQQIASLAASGCDIVRVAVPDTDDVEALPVIARKSTIPVIADIHFQWKYALAALEAGCQGIRINPGNIKKHDKVALIGREAAARGVPIRVGANAGSLEKDMIAKHGGPTPEAIVEQAMNEVRLLEEVGFTDIKISVKHNDPLTMISSYRMIAELCDYPLHLGVTEAGTPTKGVMKSSIGIGTLLAEGIGDTIRVSLTADPVEEVKAGIGILETLGLRARGFDLVACPSCGRAEVDVFALATAVEQRLAHIDVPMRVAVMGCVVNGPGEAREADVGVAAGKEKGQIFVKGEIVRTVPEPDIVEELAREAEKLADELRAHGAEGGSPHVVRVAAQAQPVMQIGRKA